MGVIKSISLASVCIGFFIAASAIVGTAGVNHATSTDEFCGASCHSMQHLSTDKTYLQSSHRINQSGVTAGCKDCHLPREFVPETWAHIRSGTRDLIATALNDYSDKDTWELRRQELAHEVRDNMIANDSKNCRYCHDLYKQKPQYKRVERKHELGEREGLTCIQCHYNLVHKAVDPREDSLIGSQILPDYTRQSIVDPNLKQ